MGYVSPRSISLLSSVCRCVRRLRGTCWGVYIGIIVAEDTWSLRYTDFKFGREAGIVGGGMSGAEGSSKSAGGMPITSVETYIGGVL